ncbi:MAG: hypothetical protein AAGC95_05575 [Pseudomonadota bacterium]
MTDTCETSAGRDNIFSRTMALSLVFIGVFSFSAYFVLSAYAPALRDGNDGRAHALSKSAVGYAALVRLLDEFDMTTTVLRGPAGDTRDGVMVYTPPRSFSLATAPALDPFQLTIIVPTKWATTPHPFRPGWVRKAPGDGIAMASSMAFEIGETLVDVDFAWRAGEDDISLAPADAFGGAILKRFGTGGVGKIDRLQHITSIEGVEPILKTIDGDAVLVKVVDAPVYILSEPDLLNTHGLADMRRAALAASFFDLARAGGPVMFDVSLHGFERTRNIIQLALEPPFLAATVCMLLAMVFLAAKAAARFGPPRRAEPLHLFGKAALADNSAALIAMSRREAEFARHYAAVVRRRIAMALNLHLRKRRDDVDAAFDRVLATKGVKASFDVAERAARTADDLDEALKAARRLYMIKKEILRERR